MPIFQTFADYDKWRRRELLKRLEMTLTGPTKIPKRPAPSLGIVQHAERAGDPSVGQPAQAATIGRATANTFAIDGKINPVLRQILRQRILDFIATGQLPRWQRGTSDATGDLVDNLLLEDNENFLLELSDLLLLE
jgi:hypothetical protein